MKTDQTIRIGCIGDSITAGARLDDPGTESFPALLEKLLHTNVTVYNFGDGGKTMRSDLGVDSYVNSGTFQRLMDVSKGLDLVTIMLGTNDAYHAKGWTQYETSTFKNDYKALVATLAEKNPSMRFIVMSSPECFGEKALRYDMIPLRSYQAELASELRSLGFKTDFFDMHKVTIPLGDHFPDKLHPDAAAHRVMAEALAEYIDKIFS